MPLSFGPELKHSLSWYALCVRLGFETTVSRTLGNKGYDPFLPLYPSTRRWSDRTKQVHLPLFPGYLFCRLNVQERLLPVLTTPGVKSILGTGSVPCAVPEMEIAAIQALIRSGLSAQPVPYLSAGDKVLIERGPLKGLEGIVLSAKSSNVEKRDRLVVSVSLLQRSVGIEIQPQWIRPFSIGDDLNLTESAQESPGRKTLPFGMADRSDPTPNERGNH
jgi:transcription antitermination factor NusG